MQIFKQGESAEARRRFYFHLVDATDGMTPETGESGGQPQLSKNGGSYDNTSATLTAIGNGAYYVELTAGELDTVGTVNVRFKTANTAEFHDVALVVAYDPFSATMGLTIDFSSVEDKVDAVRERTDRLPDDPADESLLEAAVTAVALSIDFSPVIDAVALILEQIALLPTDASLSEAHGAGKWDQVGGGGMYYAGVDQMVWQARDKTELLKAVKDIMEAVSRVLKEKSDKSQITLLFSAVGDVLKQAEANGKDFSEAMKEAKKNTSAVERLATDVEDVKALVVKTMLDDSLEESTDE